MFRGRVKKYTVFFSMFIALNVYSASPSTPILPSDNIQDPGSPLTPWGGCGPADNNCYVQLTSFNNENIIGLDYSTSTGILSLTSGYVIPTTASTTEWDNKISSQWNNQNPNIYYMSGNVGIGTSTPSAKLSVVGDISLNGSLNVMSNASLIEFGKINSETFIKFGPNEIFLGRNVNGLTGNTLIGNNILAEEGHNNIIIGEGGSVSYGGQSIIVGAGAIAGISGEDSQNMVAIGDEAFAAKTGSIAIGAFSESRGNDSIAIGRDSSANGTYNIALGYGAGIYNNATNSIAIGSGVDIRQSNTLILGGTGGFSVNVGIGTTTPIAKLSVKGNGTGSGLLTQFTDSANVARFTVLDNGNVGIGTTTPGSKLTIIDSVSSLANILSVSSASGEIFSLIPSAANKTELRISSNNSPTEYSHITAGEDPLFSGGEAVFVNVSKRGGGGRIYFGGVNSTTGAQSTAVLNFNNVTGFENTPSSILQQVTTVAGVGTGSRLGNASSNFILQMGASGYIMNPEGRTLNPSLQFLSSLADNSTHIALAEGAYRFNTTATSGALTTKPHTVWQANNSTLMSLSMNGNVGIGTTTPGSLLTVAGNGLFSGTLTVGPSSINGSTGQGVFSYGSALGALDVGADVNASIRTTNVRKLASFVAPEFTNARKVEFFNFDSSTSATAAVSIGGRVGGSQYAATTLSFITAADTSTTGGTERMTITSAGNVGIGTTTPISLLSINSATTGFSNFNQSSGTVYNQIIGPASATAGNTLLLVQSSGSMGGGGSLFRAQTSGGIGLRVSETGFATFNGGLQLPNGNILIGAGGDSNFVYSGTTNSNGITTANTPSSSAIDFIINGGKQAGTTRVNGRIFDVRNNDNVLMTVLPSGNVGVGTTTPADKLQVFGDIRVGTTGTNGCIKDYAGTGLTGVCSSDERLKTNVVDLSDGYLDKMADLKVITYKWNEQANTLNKVDTTVTNYGLLAQNVEAVFPELVTVDSNGYKQVNYSRLPLYLLKSLQELSKKVIGFADEFRTKKLCVGDTCINEEQLKILLQNQNIQTIIVPTTSVIIPNSPATSSEEVIENPVEDINNNTVEEETETVQSDDVIVEAETQLAPPVETSPQQEVEEIVTETPTE